jgi:hypothetical protein
VTPEERLLVLRGLLDRLRDNAGVRLPPPSQAEQDAALWSRTLEVGGLDEDTVEGNAALQAAAAEADVAARAATRGAVEHVVAAAPAAPRINGRPVDDSPQIDIDPSATLDLDLFDPFEDDMDLADGALDASGEHRVATVPSAATSPIPPPAEQEMAAFEDEVGDDDEPLEADEPPGIPPARPSSTRASTGWTEPPPPAISRIVATGAPAAHPEHEAEEHGGAPALELSFDEVDGDLEDEIFEPEPEPMRRAPDPLAKTAQNPVPAAMFERAILAEAGADTGDLLDDDASLAAIERSMADAVGNDEAPISEEPDSSRREVDPGRPADVGLESEPPPESGEMTSQRQPPTASLRARALDLDEATPHVGDANRVAQEALRLGQVRMADPPALAGASAEMMPAAPTRGAPAIVGRAPLSAASFRAVLDAALAFGERDS